MGMNGKENSMKTFRKILVTAAFALIVGAFIPVAKADEGNLLTQVTINKPMQVGDLVLTPGRYVFRVLDIWAPDVVSIYDSSTGHYEGMVMGTPVYRLHSTEKTTLILKEVAKKAPEVLQSWYYPDSNYGIAFHTPQTKMANTTGKTIHTAG